ncbi:hypothetical protein [Leifsonia sp. 22587]|uniref:hypothetical protein n=1 Tax=Leifsonia sp. 22587 TaxID=3453946 RepID=UPI003F87A652
MSGSGARADHGSPDLADLLAGIASGLHGAIDDAHRGMDVLLHDAAVRLLNALLPPMVHSRNALVRAANWAALEADTARLLFALGNTVIPNSVLAGQVAEKVEQGIGRIVADLDYTHGVNSIT